jgi:tetratricopeptide (TPR) repeat protein
MKRFTTIVATLLIVALGGQALLLRKLEELRPEATLEEVLYIPSPKVLRHLSLGYTSLLADIYWTRAVQYFGNKLGKRSQRFDLLYPLLDITTQLDPHLLIAYQFGSIFVSRKPGGAGRPDLAIALVERGIRENPDHWRLYNDLAYIYYWDLHDYASAAKAFEEGSKIPGALPWMRVMAGAMSQAAGNLDVARYYWSNIYNDSTQKQVHEAAAMHLRALDSDAVVGELERRIALYQDRFGRPPHDWSEMVQVGLLRRTPLDPNGVPYRLMSDGRVEVADLSDLPFVTKGLPPGQHPDVIYIYRAPLK